jgi:hypothetical protein
MICFVELVGIKVGEFEITPVMETRSLRPFSCRQTLPNQRLKRTVRATSRFFPRIEAHGLNRHQARSPFPGARDRVRYHQRHTRCRLERRIVRTVIQEAIADLDDATSEIIITIHWVGGVHTEHRLPRRRRGQRNSMPANIIEAVGQLALVAKDDVIAGLAFVIKS